MEALDGVSAEVARIFAAKHQRRQDLARLAFPEKVQAVIELQKLVRPSCAREERLSAHGNPLERERTELSGRSS